MGSGSSTERVSAPNAAPETTPEAKRGSATARVRQLAEASYEWARATPTWRAFAADRFLRAAFIVLSLSAILPLLLTPFVPLTDLGFNGLAGLLPHVVLGDDFLNQWYRVNQSPVPYWSIFFLQGVLTLVIGPSLAVKAIVGLVVLMMPLSLLRLAIALGRDPRIALLGFALVWDKNLYWGWASFQFGMCLCIWTLARLAEVRTFRRAFWLWPLTALIGITHVHAIVLLAVAGGLMAVAGRPFRRLLLVRATALSATLLPVGLWLFSVWARDRAASPAPFQFVGPPIWERVTRLFEYTLDNYRLPFDSKLALWTLLVVLVTPLVLSCFPARTLLASPDRARGNRLLLISWALFAASLVLYLELPFSVSGRVYHWWTYPRYATYAVLGLLLLPRPNLAGWRSLLLAPALVCTLALHLITARQFRAFGAAVEPLVTIQEALPMYQRLYPVSYETEVPMVQGWVIISLHGYLAMEKRAYDPHLFDTRDTPLRFRKRLPQHDWTNPYSFRFEHAREYDYVLLYQAKHRPLKTALRQGQVALVKEAGPWQLFKVLKN